VCILQGAGGPYHQVKQLTSRSGSYSSLMRSACSGVGMKPVCDHPSYCRNDANALYIGQSGHIAYRPHRNTNNYVPVGFAAIRDNWDGLCSYTNNANGNYALCNIPSNSHSWRYPAQYNPGFICGKVEVVKLWASLGAKNSVQKSNYYFQTAVLSSRSGKYSDRMVDACKSYQMKPVCDHPSYCKNDARALYIGQSGHLAYKPHRNTNSYLPTGFDKVRDAWNTLCSYTNNANGNYAMCNIPVNTHAWRHPGQYNPGFVCGVQTSNGPPPPPLPKVEKFPAGFKEIMYMFRGLCAFVNNSQTSALCNVPAEKYSWRLPKESNLGFVCGWAGRPTFKASLHAKNGVPPRAYEFAVPKLVSVVGSYAAAMIKGCNKYGMKPVCDHPQMCKHDTRALYLGQSQHISHPLQRRHPGYTPTGFAPIHNEWDGLCVFTGSASTDSA
jgi:hypothetical protein